MRAAHVPLMHFCALPTTPSCPAWTEPVMSPSRTAAAASCCWLQVPITMQHKPPEDLEQFIPSPYKPRADRCEQQLRPAPCFNQCLGAVLMCCCTLTCCAGVSKEKPEGSPNAPPHATPIQQHVRARTRSRVVHANFCQSESPPMTLRTLASRCNFGTRMETASSIPGTRSVAFAGVWAGAKSGTSAVRYRMHLLAV